MRIYRDYHVGEFVLVREPRWRGIEPAWYEAVVVLICDGTFTVRDSDGNERVVDADEIVKNERYVTE